MITILLDPAMRCGFAESEKKRRGFLLASPLRSMALEVETDFSRYRARGYVVSAAER